MKTENEDIQQEYELRQLLGKKQTKKMVAIDMWKSRAYNRLYPGSYERVNIDFIEILEYPDFDSMIDYERALKSCKNSLILRLWSERYRLKEIAEMCGCTESRICQIVKRSIKEIQEAWRI